jgi:hypothetical protein
MLGAALLRVCVSMADAQTGVCGSEVAPARIVTPKTKMMPAGCTRETATRFSSDVHVYGAAARWQQRRRRALWRCE